MGSDSYRVQGNTQCYTEGTEGCQAVNQDQRNVIPILPTLTTEGGTETLQPTSIQLYLKPSQDGSTNKVSMRPEIG